MRVLVTGGSGQLGYYACKRLEVAHKVTVFDLKKADWAEKSILGDITSIEELKHALKGQDAVVHMAGIPSYLPDHERLFRANVQGTYTLLEAAATEGVRRVIFASSICAYGLLFWVQPWIPAFLPLDESHPCWPDDVYGMSKFLGDQMCAAYTRRYGMATYCLRFAPVLFPKSEKNRRIFRAVHEPGGMAAQENVTDFGVRVTNASKLWSYVDARDAALAIELALESNYSGHQVFNIGAADVCSERPSLDLIKDYYEDIGEVRHIAAFVKNPFAALYSVERARNQLGFTAKHFWRDMVAELEGNESR